MVKKNIFFALRRFFFSKRKHEYETKGTYCIVDGIAFCMQHLALGEWYKWKVSKYMSILFYQDCITFLDGNEGKKANIKPQLKLMDFVKSIMQINLFSSLSRCDFFPGCFFSGFARVQNVQWAHSLSLSCCKFTWYFSLLFFLFCISVRCVFHVKCLGIYCYNKTLLLHTFTISVYVIAFLVSFFPLHRTKFGCVRFQFYTYGSVDT